MRGPRQNEGPRKRSAPKQPAALAACSPCRARKVACDSGRPECSRCLKRGDRCTYVTVTPDETRIEALKREISELKARAGLVSNAFKSLGAMSNGVIAEVVSQVAAAPDPETALIQALRDLSKSSEPGHVNPPTNQLSRAQVYSVDGLQELHPMIYSALLSWDEIILQFVDNSKAIITSTPLDDFRRHMSQDDAHVGTPGAKALLGPSLPSFFCATCYDSRLHHLQIQIWTSVPIDNDLAALALSRYLSSEHPLVGCFDPELFIEDLVAGNEKFCSRLLVNAVLYYACKMCATANQKATTFSSACLAEAQALLRVPALNERLYTLVATYQILSLGLFTDDKIGDSVHCLRQAQLAATELRSSLEILEKDPSCDVVMLRALHYAVWGSFNMSIMCAVFQRDNEPLEPPQCPVPTEIGRTSYRHHPRAQAARQTFIASCAFFKMHRAIGVRYLWESPAPPPPSFDLAIHFYEQILQWAEQLPPAFRISRNIPDHMATLHFFVHMVVLDLFRPLLLDTTKSTPDAETRLARFIFEASAKQLLHIVLTFSLHQAVARTGSVWISGLIYAVNVALALVDKQKSIAILRYCLAILADLTQCFDHPVVIFRSLLSLALRAGVMDMREALNINAKLRKSHREKKSFDEPKSGFLLDLDWATKMPEINSQRVEEQAENFEEQAAFEELTEFD